MASPERERLSLRTFAVASSLGIAVLTLVVVGMLMWMSSLLREDTEAAIRDTRSLALTDELETTLLMYQRVSNLYVLTEQTELDAARNDLAVRMRSLLSQASAYVGSPQEQELLVRFDGQLKAYLSERKRAEDSGRDLVGIIREANPALSDSLELMAGLREMNQTEVREAHARTLRVDRLSHLVGAATGVLLLTGTLVFALGIRRYVLEPTIRLHEGILRFRAGQSHVKVEEGVAREPAELARAFNEMVEALVRQREDLMASLAGVAHDLRNPLSALKMGIHVIERNTHSEPTLKLMRRQIDHLQRMVDDLLDATQIEAGKLEMRFEELDLRASVEHVMQLYAPASAGHEIALDLPETPITLRGDPLRIEQVIGNLLSNAIKFSPPGSRIDITVEEKNHCGLVSVTDRGIGISAEDLPELFAPFRRNRPELAPGAGLGLSVVRRIVEAHGGSVEVDSTLGKGTTFRVLLPRAPAEGVTSKAGESDHTVTVRANPG